MTNKLLDLLKQWADLQPDSCKFDKHLPIAWIGFDRYPIYYKGDLSCENWAMLQEMVQHAIASQEGWCFILEMVLDLNDEPKYSADVWRKAEEPSLSSEPQDEPAIALLIAYLEALKATAIETNAVVEGSAA
ncbi:MAG: hypothetical protein SFY66_19580 [Oculatellaceae cyanobacterium bins.114]|nr:hypothetical protein [Oculatellaceae cyanobacterium bins.114]